MVYTIKKDNTNCVMRLEEENQELNNRPAMASNFLKGRQCLYIVIALLSLLSVGLIILLLVKEDETTTAETIVVPIDAFTLCDTSGCITSACDVLHGMDVNQDPCTDFYKYSCGQWTSVPDDKSIYGVAEKAEDDIFVSLKRYLSEPMASDTNAITQAKSFYDNCTTDQSDHTYQLINMLDTYGGWPLKDGKIVNLEESLSNLIGFSANDMDTTVFNNGLFSIFVRKNEEGKNSIYLDEPQLGLDPKYLLGKDLISKKKISIYKNFIYNAAKIINPQFHDDQLKKVVNNTIDFETNLAMDLTSIEEIRDDGWNEKSRSLAEVQGYFMDENVKLINIIRKLFMDETMTISERISVLNWSNYMNNTVKSLTSARDPQPLNDFIMWRYVQYQSWFVGGELKNAYNDYYLAMNGLVHNPEIETICAKLTNSLLRFVTARMYVNENPEINNITIEAGNISTDVLKHFQERLQNLTESGTLNKTTTDSAVNKVNAVKVIMGFPQWIMTDMALEIYYNFVDDDKAKLNKGIYQNMVTMLRLVTQTEKNILQNPVSKDRWIISPVSVKVHYDPLLNTIALPLGVLKSPYFNPSNLQLSNFARLGVLVARELLHGFNVFGRQLNAEGVLENWWQTTDLKYFNNGANCFKQQYSKYCPQKSQFCVDGNRTLDENIADNGALLLAYEAAMKSVNNHRLPGFPEMTDEKLFFVQYASMHCIAYSARSSALDDLIMTGTQAPQEYRVKGTLENSMRFKQVFKCKQDPSNVCEIW